MILLDAYALIALLRDEPAAGEVEEMVRACDCGATLVNLGETADICCRRYGQTSADVRAVLGGLTASGFLTLVPPDEDVAFRAAELRQAHYAKRTCEISLADCFLLAGAGEGDEIATADPGVAAVARAERIPLVALPDSSGIRP